MNLRTIGETASHPDTGRFIIYAILGLALWLAAKGRLTGVVSAMESGGGFGGSSGGSSGSSRSTAGGSVNPAPGFPNWAQFLSVAPTSELSGFSVPDVQSLDSQGIQAEGGAYAYADWDYGVPDGSTVTLPGDSSTQYRVLPTRWGDPNRTAVVQVENGPGAGGIIEFLHLSADYATPGTTMTGGQVLGKSGHPQGPDERGSGSHLAVIPDPIAGPWLQSL